MDTERPLIIRDKDLLPLGRFVRNLAVILVGGWLYGECRIRVGWDDASDRWSLDSAGLVALVVLALLVLPFLFLRLVPPPSITVGPAGISVRGFFRSRRLRWTDIRYFSVEYGRKGRDITKPGYEDVYVFLHDSGRGPWDPDSFRLPRFDSCTAEELAATLTEQQRLHAQAARPTASAGPASAAPDRTG
jgi:hypothetical protein